MVMDRQALGNHRPQSAVGKGRVEVSLIQGLPTANVVSTA
jgi:hypothetical protein